MLNQYLKKDMATPNPSDGDIKYLTNLCSFNGNHNFLHFKQLSLAPNLSKIKNQNHELLNISKFKLYLVHVTFIAWTRKLVNKCNSLKKKIVYALISLMQKQIRSFYQTVNDSVLPSRDIDYPWVQPLPPLPQGSKS